ncbi:MAG: ABC transporter permease [Lachnospiraceae bacterium]|jgi:putative ABC transport system permease protein|nr:ABC transporter permease [Lachnospiraceae bacterium]MCI9470472.1 ABC transporter permease [Lachnospiraceae bacterium]
MKNMLSVLAGRSFRASRMRNLIATSAIILTTILFTTVTTVGMGATGSITLTMQMLKGSRSDGDFHNMTAEQYAALEDADFIREYGLRMPVGFLEDTTRHNIEFDVLDPVQADLTFCMPVHGSVPKAENEIVTSDTALRDLGVEPEVGADVTISFTAHGREYQLDMVVSGWFEATSEQISMMWAGTAFRDAHPDIFEYTYDRDRDMAGTYYSDFIATSTAGLQENLDHWVRQMGGDPDAANSDHLSATINTVTNPALDPTTLLLVAVMIALFVLCGYLLIYNVFDIAVMQEIRRYGLYRTVGMSKRQVKKLINLQAVWLSCIGIPLGLLIGYFVGKAALPYMMRTLSSSYENIAIHVDPSPIVFVGAAVLAAFTVFLSTRKPMRAAADIPPIEAFRYVETAGGRKTTKKSTAGTSLFRLAWSDLGRNKRRFAFIVASLSLCVILLNCIGIAADSVDIEKQVSYSIRTDFTVVNALSKNILKGFTRREHGLGQEVIDAVNAQPGVKGASAIYKNTLDDRNVTYDFPVGFDLIGTDEETGIDYASTKDGIVFNLGDDGHALCNVYGMEETALARMDIQEGEADAHKLYEKMVNGEGVLVGVMSDMGTSIMEPALDLLEVGDIITVFKNGGPMMELPVLAKAALTGDDTEIRYTANGPFEVGRDGLFLYLPTCVYTEIYDEPVIYKYSFDVEEGQQDPMRGFLEDYVTNVDPSLGYASAEEARQDAATTRTMLQFVGGLIGSIFGAVGVLNLINTIITSILTRRHEFAIMQSIGMTAKQLTRMMIWESVYYAIGVCIVGLLLSVILAFTVVKTLIGDIWYFTFHFTLVPAVTVCILLLIAAAVLPVIALKVFNKGSIVEKLRVAE